MILDIILALLLVFLNGFFVAAEFAIVKVRSSQITLQSGTRSKRAAEVIIHNLDGFLAATQLGITLASLGLGWIGEGVVAAIILDLVHSFNFELSESTAHNIAFPVAFVIITILHIVFGELAPKSIAIRYPTSTTLTVSIPLRIFYIVFKPFINLLNGFANLMLKSLGIKPVHEHEIHSEEELKLIIAESVEGGQFEDSERELIQNVFDFDDRHVKQIMVPRVRITGIKAETPIEEAIRFALAKGYSRYPVYTKSIDDVQGIVHTKDLMRAFIDGGGSSKSLAIMKDAHYVHEHKRIDHLLREFQRMKIQMAIVISEYGGTIGLVTLEDIIEELVGDIQDEHDHETQIVKKLSFGYRVLAKSSVRDINKFLDVPLPESEDYETLAGLLTYHHQASLSEGDILNIDGYEIKVIKMKRYLPEIVELKFLKNSTDNPNTK